MEYSPPGETQARRDAGLSGQRAKGEDNAATDRQQEHHWEEQQQKCNQINLI